MKPLVCILAVTMLVVPTSAQSGQQLMVTLRLAGAVQDKGGVYYIAFTVSDSLLAGPQPDSSNWTHYVVYREGRFFFGTVPAVTAAQPFGFVAVRPPAPFIYGQVLPDRQTLRITVPLADLGIGPLSLGRLKINFVTVDEQSRALDALGPGANDRLGFVLMETRRELFKTVRDPRGDCSDPNFDILGGEIQISTP